MFVFQLQGWVPTDNDLSQMINNFSSLASFGDSAGKLKMFIIDHKCSSFNLINTGWLNMTYNIDSVDRRPAAMEVMKSEECKGEWGENTRNN